MGDYPSAIPVVEVGARMMGSLGSAPSVNSSVFVCNLPPRTSEALLADHFGKTGLVKPYFLILGYQKCLKLKDRPSGAPLISLYLDKIAPEPNGDATVAVEDPHAAAAAVKWYNNTESNGNITSVSPIEGVQSLNFVATSVTLSYPTMQGVPEHGTNSTFAGETCGSHGGEYGGNLERAGGPVDLEGVRRRGRGDGKPWQQEGDWPCPNSSCLNINFAFRGVCNRCGSARPSGHIASRGGVTGGDRGRSRGANDAGSRGRGSGGLPGLFGPNDWNCPMCGNINWAKRLKCNICNTSKPGYGDGGAREGRAGGFKEFDEAEVEETKRRRREKVEDDGEMYDEFGNLKKKFRAKVEPGSALSLAGAATGVGKAGWDTDIGVIEGYTREKGKDRSAYSCSSDRHENEKESGYTNLKSTRPDHREYHHKDRGCKRSRGDF